MTNLTDTGISDIAITGPCSPVGEATDRVSSNRTGDHSLLAALAMLIMTGHTEDTVITATTRGVVVVKVDI